GRPGGAAKPGGCEACGEGARRGEPVDFWPVLGTGSPDLLQSRQFGRRGQCFHFMADSPDWRASDPDPASGATIAMTRTSYERCLRLLTSLFDEIVHDPYVATLRGRGGYVLLHAVADSYSKAHVEREDGGAGRIRFLKGWILRNWFVYLIDVKHLARRFQPSIVDSRDSDEIDADRVVAGRRCGDVAAPYELPLECLSVEGRAAAMATVDALVTLQTAMRHRAGAASGSSEGASAALPLNLDRESSTAMPAIGASLDDPAARAAWRGFLERRMASAYAPLEVERQRAGEREWQPNLMIAARLRPGFGGGYPDARLPLGGLPGG